MLKLKRAEDVCQEIRAKIENEFLKRHSEDYVQYAYQLELERLIKLIDQAIYSMSKYIIIHKYEFFCWEELNNLLQENGYHIIEYNSSAYIIFDSQNVDSIHEYIFNDALMQMKNKPIIL